MPDTLGGPVLGDALLARRRRRFVGRAAEIELVRACLDAEAAPFSLLFVHGPGGIGKSALLDAFAAEAEGAGVRTVRVDGRDVLATPDALTAATREAVDPVGQPGDGPQGGGTQPRRTILMLDSYERLATLDDWVRTELVPEFPASTLVVLAGRNAPSTRWRADPAWQGLLRVVALRNLAPAETEEFLRRCAVPAELHRHILEVSYGHPLGLSLLADLAVRSGVVDVGRSPDLVTGLLEHFLDTVPDPVQRQGLLASALARVTTEPLLRAALDTDDAHRVFDWLRELSFVEAGPEGLFPHDLARDVIDRDLRWRDPQAYGVVFRRVRAFVHDQVATLTGDALQRGMYDEKFVFRNLPTVPSPVDWSSWGGNLAGPAEPAERTRIVELIGRYEGAESAAVAERWFDRQPEAFQVLRDGATVTGCLALLDLSEAAEEDRRADPGTRAAWQHVQAYGGIHPGQRVTFTRFIVDHERYQAPSPSLNAVATLTVQRYLATPELAWDFLALHEPDRWNDYFALADMPRIAGADFIVGGRSYGLFAHDFRAVPIAVMMERWTEHTLGEKPSAARPADATPVMLSQPDFAEAVRQGLRDLDRADLLARNPLVRTRLLAGAGPQEPSAPERLAQLLRDAIESLAADPRRDKQYRAVEQTYLGPSRTQEAAAARLRVPFSTYRRHLSQGVDLVVSWCWQREIYGPDPPTDGLDRAAVSTTEHH